MLTDDDDRTGVAHDAPGCVIENVDAPTKMLAEKAEALALEATLKLMVAFP